MNFEDFLTLGTLYCLISATRGNIVRIDSATDDTIRVSLTVAIRFTDASVNRYTPIYTTGTIAKIRCQEVDISIIDRYNSFDNRHGFFVSNGNTNLNTLRLRQNGCHFPEDICKCIFMNENVWILIEIPLGFVRKGPIDNIPALVQIMAWCWSGSKPLSQPMMFSLLMYICITQPQ